MFLWHTNSNVEGNSEISQNEISFFCENAIIENIFFNFLKKLMKIFQALKSIGSTDVISDKARQAMINGDLER